MWRNVVVALAAVTVLTGCAATTYEPGRPDMTGFADTGLTISHDGVTYTLWVADDPDALAASAGKEGIPPAPVHNCYRLASLRDGRIGGYWGSCGGGLDAADVAVVSTPCTESTKIRLADGAIQSAYRGIFPWMPPPDATTVTFSCLDAADVAEPAQQLTLPGR